MWEILFMNKRLYIILGQSNSHKSSVMRCLTGCSRKRGNWQMRFANNQIETCYISVSSPQERDIVGVSVVQFIEEIKNLVEDTIFITLQSNSTTQQPMERFIFKRSSMQDLIYNQ